MEGIDWSAVDDVGCGIELEVSGDVDHKPVLCDRLDGLFWVFFNCGLCFEQHVVLD